MLEFDLSACDLNFRPSVGYTYESVSRSWIDHILCSQHMSSCITDIKTVQSASTSPDHFPLLFQISISCSHLPSSPSVATTTQHAHIDWSEVSSADVEKYNHTVSCSIRELPSNVSACMVSDCNQHHDILDAYARNLITSLLDSASQCFPTYHKSSTRKLTGWKEFAGNLKRSANFWHRI